MITPKPREPPDTKPLVRGLASHRVNLVSDVRMIIYQLRVLADRVELAGRPEEALRLREIMLEIKRLSGVEGCSDPGE